MSIFAFMEKLCVRKKMLLPSSIKTQTDGGTRRPISLVSSHA